MFKICLQFRFFVYLLQFNFDETGVNKGFIHFTVLLNMCVKDSLQLVSSLDNTSEQ